MSSKIIPYLRQMATSLLLMVLIVYGMATENTWLQFGGVLIVIAIQFLWMIIQSVRSGPLIQQNMEDARRARKSKILLRVQKREVDRAKAGSGGDGMMSMGKKTMLMMSVNLGVFMGTGYLLSMFVPEIPRWQSFAIAFLTSMPVSTILMIRMGVGATGPAVTPDDYYVSQKGIVFDRMRSTFLVRFPLQSLKTSKGKKLIEVEGAPTGSAVIPNRVRLYTENVDRLQRILAKFVVKESAAR